MLRGKYSVRTIRLLLFSLIVTVAIILAAAAVWRSTAFISEDAVVLTIDDYPVTVQEFRVFLRQNKALTASYFKRKYNADPSNNFWTTTYQGERPLEYAKQKTIEDLKKIKVEQILMKEHGILQDISYKTFLKKLASENNDRQRKLRNDQPIYGPREYEAEEFYSYTHSMNLQHFIDTLAKEKGKLLTDAELKPFYERVKSDYFHQGYVFEYEKIRIAKGIDAPNRLKSLQKYVLTENMGVQEAIGRLKHAQGIEYQRETLDLDVKSKDDAAAYNLQKMLMSIRPGDFTDMAQDDDGVIMHRLLEAKNKGYAPYDQVKSALVQIYMEKQLEQQMDQRLRDAQIRMNQEVLEQISFS